MVLRNVRAVIKGNKSAAAGSLICQVNPIIRGWAMYHRHAVSAKVFQSVDHAIFQALWRWAKRRHPHKGVQWVKARYFHTVGDRNWVFSGKARGPKGQPEAVHLLPPIVSPSHGTPRSRARPIPTTRHGSSIWRSVSVSRWQPHSRDVEPCCISGDAKRGAVRTVAKPSLTLTGWHSHHKVWRSHGGSDTADNRVLLHPTCHRQVHHALGSTRMPPLVTRGFGKA